MAKTRYVSSTIRAVTGAALLMLLVACAKKDASSSSKFRFTLPPHPNVSSKSTNTNVAATADTFCYLVNVTAADLPSVAKNCYPAKGQVTAFLPPSSTVAMEVSRGDDRTIELYAYRAQAGETCASPAKDLQNVNMARLFFMGAAKGISTRNDVTNVTLEAKFPGLNMNYVTANNLLASCPLPVERPPGGIPYASHGGVLTGAKYVVKGGLDRTSNIRSQTGSKYQIHSGVKNVTQ